MKKRNIIIVLTLLGLIAILMTFHPLTSPPVAARPVKVVITGPDGQRFTGRYVADGVTNVVSAVAPATIKLHARNFTYEFQRNGGDGEFRVALFVEDLCRTSTTSDRRHGVRGEVRYAADHENYWAAGF